ncbi:hypothetical protein D7V97_25490 [Corallococcus sp. CA053C]|uniref:hypothetical protein n=1 Tax=Corallococcus sp. CA053C TaxID=2316732 RepID=UPI000EA32473|nr:hypothetical protein [Corallococcus sp. CA053C]RKH04323.1 hypothetical protein D7V97_25490 [Corallococcus sp. CA053C]
MALLGNLLGALTGSGRARSGWNRGRTSYGRRPIGYGARGRQTSSGFGGSLGRMALSGLAAYGIRRFLSNRRSASTGY